MSARMPACNVSSCSVVVCKTSGDKYYRVPKKVVVVRISSDLVSSDFVTDLRPLLTLLLLLWEEKLVSTADSRFGSS